MVVERIVSGTEISGEEEKFYSSLRPSSLDEFVGQKPVIEKLNIAIAAARQRNESVEHVLFYGPPGLGKTTLAHIIAKELKTNIVVTSGPVLQRSGDLMGVLTNLQKGDVLFIDEIHRLPMQVEEFLYPAMEDFKIDFVVDKGAFAKTINVVLAQFTLVGATTRAGFLSAPLRERFGLYYHLEFYPDDELASIILRSAKILDIKVDRQLALVIAQRARGTPRVANRLLRRVRDYAQVRADGVLTGTVVDEALKLEGIDRRGLDQLDRKFIGTIIEYYNGGPVGIETLAATLNEEIDTVQDMIEPYLLTTGLIARTKSGRKATPLAYEYLGKPQPINAQGDLFNK